MNKDRILEKEIEYLVKRYNIKFAIDILFPKLRFLIYFFFYLALFAIVLFIVNVFLFPSDIDMIKPSMVISFSQLSFDLFRVVIFSFAIMLLITISALGFQKRLYLVKKIFLLRLVISILSGWLLFFASEEFWEIEFGLKNSYIIYFISVVLLVIFFFMFIEVRSLLTYKNPYKRVLTIMGISLIISFNVGLFLMPNVMTGILDNSSVLINEPIHYRNEILHKMKEKDSLTEINDKIKSIMSIYDAVLIRKLVNLNTNIPQTKTKILSKTDSIRNDSVGFNFEIIQINNYNQRKAFFKTYLNSIDIMRMRIRKPIFHETNSINTILKKGNSQITIDNLRSDKGMVELKQLYLAILTNEFASLQNKLSSNYKKIINIKKIIDSLNRPKEIRNWYTSKGVMIESTLWKMSYHPKLLIFQTFLAMFFGVFVQLLIQDKTVTESI